MTTARRVLITVVPRARPWRRTIASSCGSSRRWNAFPAVRSSCSATAIQATALDMLERLIEATYSRRRGGHLAAANLGLEKNRFLFRPVRDLRVVDPGRDEHAVRSIDETGHRVGAWTKAHDA